eukprot:236801_1
MAIEHGCVTGADGRGVVEHDNLGVERAGLHGGVVAGVGSDVATADVLDRETLDVEADVVTGESLLEGLVVHLDRLALSGHTARRKRDVHARLEDTGLDTADGNSPDAANLVHVLERKAEGLVDRAGRGLNGVNGVNERLTSGL